MGNLVGRALAHFHIEAQLGEGGMGVVYRATDEKLRRQVALKVLPESFAKDEDRRRRFLREARSAAAITHANIATVYDVGEADGQIFIAMELIEGDTLRALIDKGVSVPEGVRIAKEIARGLGRAHDKGIVHRDLKPENVMVSRHDEVKILDFGLAKLHEAAADTASAARREETASNLTGPGRLLGTPAYMSPEQARGMEVDARTDVFSFGVVLYEMVAGGRPFVGQTTQDVITSVLRDTPARASRNNPLVPQAIEQVIERCLEKDRDARYANGQELLRALSADVPEPRASEPSSGRKVGNAPTVSLDTPGPSTVGAKGTARWRWGLALFGGLSAVGLAWDYQTRGAGSGTSVTNASPGAAPATSATPLPASSPPSSPPQQTQVPEAATEPAEGSRAETPASSVSSAASPAPAASKPSRPVVPAASTAPSARVPTRRKPSSVLFETQD